MNNQAKKTVASHAGFHFANLYQCCPRKFYFRHLCKLDTPTAPFSLLFGAAFHEAKAKYYTSQDFSLAANVGMNFLRASRKLFETPAAYDKALERLTPLLEAWIFTLGRADLLNYDIVAVERDFVMQLPGSSFIFTGRIDAVVREKVTKKYYIFDTKTSGTSEDLTVNSVMLGDQATGYLALAAANGVKAEGLVADVAYWHKNAKSDTNIHCFRSDLVKRSKQQQLEFTQGVSQLFSEVSQRVEAVKEGKAPASVFSRNTYYCNAFFKACEFAPICRKNIAIGSKPKGYVLRDQGTLISATTDGLGET